MEMICWRVLQQQLTLIEHIRVLENSSENKCTFHKEDRNIICSDSPPHIFHHWQRWGEKFSAVVNILSFAQFTWSSCILYTHKVSDQLPKTICTQIKIRRENLARATLHILFSLCPLCPLPPSYTVSTMSFPVRCNCSLREMCKNVVYESG